MLQFQVDRQTKEAGEALILLEAIQTGLQHQRAVFHFQRLSSVLDFAAILHLLLLGLVLKILSFSIVQDFNTRG